MSLDQSERSKWLREKAQNFNFTHFFLIINIIIRCSGMFHVPVFIDGRHDHAIVDSVFKTLQIF